MPPLGSDVPLEKSILEVPINFNVTAFEWLSFNGILILRNTNATQAGKLFYEVPVGKLFFLVACSLNAENVTSSGSFEAKLAVDELQFSFSTSTSLLQVSALQATGPGLNHSISSSYAIPLRFEAGFKFFAYDNPSANGNSEALIQGYEIPKNLAKPGF